MQTSILDTVARTLSEAAPDSSTIANDIDVFSIEKAIYYSKLEALWILTNLSMTTDIEIIKFMVSGPVEDDQMDCIEYSFQLSLMEILKDILDCFVEEGAKDVKTFTQVFYALSNIIAFDTSKENTKMLMKFIADNSSILESI